MLERIGLRSLVEEWPERLQHLLADSGENLSMGQRQLLCLGRALLRPSRILVMDEASASLDLQCDQLMKRVIASSFASCTTLTIAHRLNTVLGSDRIAVFEAGRLKEFDSPAALLRQNGLLKRLLDDAASMTKDIHEQSAARPSAASEPQSELGQLEKAERRSKAEFDHGQPFTRLP